MTNQLYKNLSLIKPNNPILNKLAKEVLIKDIKTPEIQELINKMYNIAYGEQGDKQRKTMVGLAAPQIGISKRIIIAGTNSVGLGEQPKLKEFINPKIIYKSKTKEEGREGCYSTGNVCGIVQRAKTIKVVAYDRNGKKFQKTFNGFPGRIIQHEIDHLEGIRFPDLIKDDLKLHWVESSEFGDYRVNWETWTILCSREKWLKIKVNNNIVKQPHT